MQAKLPSAGLGSALSSKSKKINLSKLFLDVSMARLSVIQGDSKRLWKVYVSISLIIFGPGDLKFCTEQLQNYTIWYIRWDRPKTHYSI